jgi:DNA-binding LacI/PurR family transcriptional regulator
MCQPYAPRRVAFTHIEQDQLAMVRTAVDFLAAQLAGREVPPRTIVPHRLVERTTPS